MPDPIEELVTKLLDADAKMTKGPWVRHQASFAAVTSLDEVNKRHGAMVLAACGSLSRNFKEDELRAEQEANANGIALLRNTAPVVAKVIEHFLQTINDARHSPIGPEEADACLAHVAKLIEESNAK